MHFRVGMSFAEEFGMTFLAKLFVAILVIAYIVSPIDIAPAIPVDDIVVAIGGASYVLIPKNK